VARLVKDTFSVWYDNWLETLYLLEVDDMLAKSPTQQFTLVFLGRRELGLSDGIHPIMHPTAGTADVFLQAAGQDRVYSYNRASFNLLRERLSALPRDLVGPAAQHGAPIIAHARPAKSPPRGQESASGGQGRGLTL
jgi:hypothetical protein